MKKILLLTIPAVLMLCSGLGAQAHEPGEVDYVQLARERGIDSVDLSGFLIYHEIGTQEYLGKENSAPFRYEPPSDGIPLFVANPGFETVNYTGWSGYIGDNTVSSYGPLQNQQAGIFTSAVNPPINDMNARQSIMTDTTLVDGIGGFPIIPTGYGIAVARLGNNYAQYQGQEIEQSWVVTAHDSFFCMSYAVVINIGGHLAGEGGYFMYEIVDSTGTQLFARNDQADVLPSDYTILSTEGYLPWTTDTFNLSAYIGTTLTVRFTASGCIYGGHYAYCYLDLDPNHSSTTEVAENEIAAVRVYPNPSATGIYSVTCESSATEEIPIVYDMSGRIVNAGISKTTNGWTIDLSQCAPGIYSLSVITNEGATRTSLVR